MALTRAGRRRGKVADILATTYQNDMRAAFGADMPSALRRTLRRRIIRTLRNAPPGLVDRAAEHAESFAELSRLVDDIARDRARQPAKGPRLVDVIDLGDEETRERLTRAAVRARPAAGRRVPLAELADLAGFGEECAPTMPDIYAVPGPN